MTTNFPSEARIQYEICQWLQSNGYYFFSVSNEAAGRSKISQMQLISMGLRSGVSDLVVVLPEGRVVFIEVKAENGKQSPAQVKFQSKVESLGHKYFLVRSVKDVDTLLRLL